MQQTRSRVTWKVLQVQRVTASRLVMCSLELDKEFRDVLSHARGVGGPIYIYRDVFRVSLDAVGLGALAIQQFLVIQRQEKERRAEHLHLQERLKAELSNDTYLQLASSSKQFFLLFGGSPSPNVLLYIDS